MRIVWQFLIKSETDTHLNIDKGDGMAAMVTLQESIDEKYGEKESEAEVKLKKEAKEQENLLGKSRIY